MADSVSWPQSESQFFPYKIVPKTRARNKRQFYINFACDASLGTTDNTTYLFSNIYFITQPWNHMTLCYTDTAAGRCDSFMMEIDIPNTSIRISFSNILAGPKRPCLKVSVPNNTSSTRNHPETLPHTHSI